MRIPTALDASAEDRAAPLSSERRWFSHLSAARIWGCPLPPHVDLRAHLSAHRRAPRVAGVVGHKAPPHAAPVRRRGLPVSDPITTWLQLAVVLPFDELVACGDHLVHRPRYPNRADPRPYVDREALVAAAAEYRGRGAIMARAAAAAVRSHAASRPETLIRLLLERSGLPIPELNADVYDADGNWIAYCDLVFRDAKVAVEYDGDQHRTDRRQYERDRQRLDALADAGWNVIHVRADALFNHPASVVARVRRALEASRGQ
ncbi:endonuclease domain-containing protein [Arenivirga flava]|uniref:endonuclease domain-containing protein n=1 Tax=Arenivirga flava TaxID=1930060 RepID=UPI0024E126C6|nr:DUF559 domain-containing protein [Arenivirga flava]